MQGVLYTERETGILPGFQALGGAGVLIGAI